MTARRRRGLIAAALLLLAAPAAAHDPGLSSLDVRLHATRVVLELSIAASDLATVADFRQFALDAVTVRIDGRTVPGAVVEIVADGRAGARARLEYRLAAGTQLSISSEVPSRLARGHRQLLSVRNANGALLSERMLDAESTPTVVQADADTGARTPTAFFTLGVAHIVGGYDHLLFLAGLLLAVRGRRQVVAIITAFTIAHSVTLAASVVGLMELPAALIEPLIAASIVYVGLENLLRREVCARWQLSFAFGLIHGFGFAGALRDLGIGGTTVDVAVPLGLFNLGVEAGQLGVAMVMVPIMWRLRRTASFNARLSPVCSSVVVLLGAYWLVERTMM